MITLGMGGKEINPDVEVRYRFDFIKDQNLKENYEFLKGRDEMIKNLIPCSIEKANVLDKDTAYIDVIQAGIKEPFTSQYDYYEYLQDDKGNMILINVDHNGVDYDEENGFDIEIEDNVPELCTRWFVNDELMYDDRRSTYEAAVIPKGMQMEMSEENKNLIRNVIEDLEQLLSAVEELQEKGVKVPISDKDLAQMKEDHKGLTDLQLNMTKDDIKAMLDNDDLDDREDI